MLPYLFHVKRFLPFVFMFIINVSLAQHSSSTRLEVKPLPTFPNHRNDIGLSYENLPGYTELKPEVKEWYYWTNFTRRRPRDMWDSVIAPILKVYPQLNTGYTKSLKDDLYQAGELVVLTPNEKLLAVSNGHARDMAQTSKASHTSSDGTTFETRMKRAGIINCAGENISVGAANTILALVFLLIDEGIPDVGHRKALLNADYKELGVGLVKNKATVYVVQDFACNQSDAR